MIDLAKEDMISRQRFASLMYKIILGWGRQHYKSAIASLVFKRAMGRGHASWCAFWQISVDYNKRCLRDYLRKSKKFWEGD